MESKIIEMSHLADREKAEKRSETSVGYDASIFGG